MSNMHLTPTQLGWKVGDKFEVIGDQEGVYEIGDIVEMIVADNDNIPLFKRDEDDLKHYLCTYEVRSISSKSVEVDEVDKYKQLFLSMIVAGIRYNGHYQTQVAIDPTTDLQLLLDICGELEVYLLEKNDFRGMVFLNIHTDKSWSIYASKGLDGKDGDTVLLSCVD